MSKRQPKLAPTFARLALALIEGAAAAAALLNLNSLPLLLLLSQVSLPVVVAAPHSYKCLGYEERELAATEEICGGGERNF